MLAQTSKHLGKTGAAQREDPKLLSAKARRLSSLGLESLFFGIELLNPGFEVSFFPYGYNRAS